MVAQASSWRSSGRSAVAMDSPDDADGPLSASGSKRRPTAGSATQAAAAAAPSASERAWAGASAPGRAAARRAGRQVGAAGSRVRTRDADCSATEKWFSSSSAAPAAPTTWGRYG